MNEEEKRADSEWARAQLELFGVPPPVAEAALKHQPAPWLEFAQLAVFLVLMLGGFAVGGWLIWPALEQLTADNARRHAEAAGALLYSYNFGLSMVLAMFAWIFVAGLPAALIPLRSARLRASAFVTSILKSEGSPIARWLVRKQLDALRDERDPEAYVSKATSDGLRLLGVAAVVLAALSVAAVFRDVQANRVYTAEGYIHAPFFPWASRDLRRWEDATRVELGCNYIARDNESAVIYQVHFADGAKAHPASARALDGRWIDRLQDIDLKLRRNSQARFERWTWLNRDPMHPQCIAAMQEWLGPAYPSLQVILRTGGFPGALD